MPSICGWRRLKTLSVLQKLHLKTFSQNTYGYDMVSLNKTNVTDINSPLAISPLNFWHSLSLLNEGKVRWVQCLKWQGFGLESRFYSTFCMEYLLTLSSVSFPICNRETVSATQSMRIKEAHQNFIYIFLSLQSELHVFIFPQGLCELCQAIITETYHTVIHCDSDHWAYSVSEAQ